MKLSKRKLLFEHNGFFKPELYGAAILRRDPPEIAMAVVCPLHRVIHVIYYTAVNGRQLRVLVGVVRWRFAEPAVL